jgi:hypothetical protein
MRRLLRKSLIVAALAVVGVGLTTVPAHAGPPWQVEVTEEELLGFSYDSRIALIRSGPWLDILCAVSIFEIAAQDQAPVYPGGQIATIDASSWEACPGAGIDFTLQGGHPWNLHVEADGDSFDDVHVISLRNLRVDLTAIDGACTATIQGDAPGYYTNSTSTLTMAPAYGTNTLTVTSADCFHLIQVGDDVELHGDYFVTDNWTLWPLTING